QRVEPDHGHGDPRHAAARAGRGADAEMVRQGPRGNGKIMAAVSLRDVRKSYTRELQVIHGVSMEIADGEFIVILGPSGCGKSTLLRMVAGLETISAGEIAIGGRVVN